MQRPGGAAHAAEPCHGREDSQVCRVHPGNDGTAAVGKIGRG